MEEINLGMFIQSMLIVATMEPRPTVPSDLTTEVILAIEVASAPLVTITNKGKGIVEEEEEEEDEPSLGGLNLTPLAIDIPLTGLSEEQQLALAIKASVDTIQEE